MAKTKVKTVADKLSRVNETFTVNMYDNGFMIEVSGSSVADSEDEELEWCTAKIIVPTVEDLCELINEIASMERKD